MSHQVGLCQEWPQQAVKCPAVFLPLTQAQILTGLLRNEFLEQKKNQCDRYR
jgi:hypothetical protein